MFHDYTGDLKTEYAYCYNVFLNPFIGLILLPFLKNAMFYKQ